MSQDFCQLDLSHVYYIDSFSCKQQHSPAVVQFTKQKKGGKKKYYATIHAGTKEISGVSEITGVSTQSSATSNMTNVHPMRSIYEKEYTHFIFLHVQTTTGPRCIAMTSSWLTYETCRNVVTFFK